MFLLYVPVPVPVSLSLSHTCTCTSCVHTRARHACVRVCSPFLLLFLFLLLSLSLPSGFLRARLLIGEDSVINKNHAGRGKREKKRKRKRKKERQDYKDSFLVLIFGELSRARHELYIYILGRDHVLRAFVLKRTKLPF